MTKPMPCRRPIIFGSEHKHKRRGYYKRHMQDKYIPGQGAEDKGVGGSEARYGLGRRVPCGTTQVHSYSVSLPDMSWTDTISSSSPNRSLYRWSSAIDSAMMSSTLVMGARRSSSFEICPPPAARCRMVSVEIHVCTQC